MKILTWQKIRQQRDWQTQQTHQHVCHSQVDDEVIGDIVHPGVPVYDADHEAVPNDANEEHHAIGEGVNCYHMYMLSDEAEATLSCAVGMIGIHSPYVCGICPITESHTCG